LHSRVQVVDVLIALTNFTICFIEVFFGEVSQCAIAVLVGTLVLFRLVLLALITFTCFVEVRRHCLIHLSPMLLLVLSLLIDSFVEAVTVCVDGCTLVVGEELASA